MEWRGTGRTKEEPDRRRGGKEWESTREKSEGRRGKGGANRKTNYKHGGRRGGEGEESGIERRYWVCRREGKSGEPGIRGKA